jgi:NADP-dependent 3-hydroxy acid dehydrogenase YdfG
MHTHTCTSRQPAVKEITVVNVSSISAIQPYEAFGVYAAGKVRWKSPV